MTKKIKLNLIASFLLFLLALITTITSAFLLIEISKDKNIIVGKVKVDYDIYFTKDGKRSDASFVVIDEKNGLLKTGIYYVNMDNPDDNSYIAYINIDILVESNVDTYVRIKLFEQLSLKMENSLGEITEIAIISDNIDFQTYSDSSIKWVYYDGYYYCNTPLKAHLVNGEYVSKRVKFIVPFANGYNPSPPNYFLQIALEIDAVQAIDGPKNVWNVTLPLD